MTFVLTFRANMDEAQQKTLLDEMKYYGRAIKGVADDLGVTDAEVTLESRDFFLGTEEL